MKVILVTVLLAIMQAVPPVPRQAANTRAGGNQTVKQDSGDKRAPAAPVAVPNTVSTQKNEHPSEAPAKANPQEPIVIHELPPVSVTRDWVDLISVFFTGILIIVGGLGVCAAYRTLKIVERQTNAVERSVEVIQSQAISMRLQTGILRNSVRVAGISAQAAKDSAEAVINSERAWLLATPTLPGALRVGAPNTGLVFTWVIKNAGRTPARIIETDAAAWRVKDLKAIPPSPKYEGKPASLNNFLLVPNDSLPLVGLVEPFGDPLTAEEIDEIAHRKLTLLAYGYVRYLDSFEREHTTRFCHTYFFHSLAALERFEPYWNAPPEYTQCD